MRWEVLLVLVPAQAILCLVPASIFLPLLFCIEMGRGNAHSDHAIQRKWRCLMCVLSTAASASGLECQLPVHCSLTIPSPLGLPLIWYWCYWMWSAHVPLFLSPSSNSIAQTERKTAGLLTLDLTFALTFFAMRHCIAYSPPLSFLFENSSEVLWVEVELKFFLFLFLLFSTEMINDLLCAFPCFFLFFQYGTRTRSIRRSTPRKAPRCVCGHILKISRLLLVFSRLKK